MRLNIVVKTEHSEIATCVAWSSDCKLFSGSDDKIICIWNSDGECASKINTVTAFPSCISFLPQSGKQANDMFAMSCTDGTFRFISRSGQEAKKVSAHQGAVIKIRWSHDGSALLSAGEDGDVKVWSKSGNVRSTLATTGQSVYDLCWGPDDDQVVIASGNNLMIKTVQASRKNLEWVAHEGVILCVDWNVANNFIVSGSEDCTYRIWDSFGRQLFSSRVLEHVVTSVAWSPNGESFAVGSHNLLRLCDKTGWTHCRERVAGVGSILDIAWTSDGTQCAGATGNGCIVFAQVVDRRLEWKNTEVTLIEPRKIRVQDMANETVEDLEYARDRVVDMGLGHDTLVVATTTQCYVYNIQNLNTPIIFDIRAPPHFIHLCKRHFLTMDPVSGLQVISFEGKVLCSPKFQGFRAEYCTRELVALSADTIAVVDSVDTKKIQIMDATSGRLISKISHSAEVVNVALNQHVLGPQDRLLLFGDKNKDLLIAFLGGGQAAGGAVNFPVSRLHGHVDSFHFNDETDVVVGLADGHMNIWYHPSVLFVDKDLLTTCMSSTETADLGRNAQVVAFTGNRITVRKVDGSVQFFATPPDISLLYELIRGNRWEESTRLCRHQNSSVLWGTLAAAALTKKQLDTVEIAFCELNEVAKVEYIQFIKSVPSDEGRQAELALYRRQPEEAERILLQASPPLIYRAIKLNLRLFRFNRALSLAVKHKSPHVQTVLYYRNKFLTEFQREEGDKAFLQISSQFSFDREDVQRKEEQELIDESRRGSKSK